MNNTLKTLAIVSVSVTVTFIILIIIGMAITSKNNTPDLSTLRNAFNSECIIVPEFADYCNCAFDTLVANMGIKNLTREGIAMIKTDYISPYMDYQLDVAVDACLYKL